MKRGWPKYLTMHFNHFVHRTWYVVWHVDVLFTTGTLFRSKLNGFFLFFSKNLLTTRWWQDHVWIFWVGCDLGNPSAMSHKGSTSLKCFSHFSWIKFLRFTSDHFHKRIEKERRQHCIDRKSSYTLNSPSCRFSVQYWPMQRPDDISEILMRH